MTLPNPDPHPPGRPGVSTRKRRPTRRLADDLRNAAQVLDTGETLRGYPELLEHAAATVDRLTEALRAIAEPDELLDANEGAFNVHAAKRMQEIARTALSLVLAEAATGTRGEA